MENQTKQIKEQDTKQVILDCALELFSSKGYDAVGVAELVSQANITKPTLYYYFGSKEGVFRAILDKYYGLFNKTLKENAIYDPEPDEYDKDIYPVLSKIVQTYFEFAKNHTSFYLMMMALTFSPKSSVSATVVKPYLIQQYKILFEMFEDISKVHTNLKEKESRLGRNLAALINSNITSWIYDYGTLDEQEVDRLIRQFMHGIFA